MRHIFCASPLFWSILGLPASLLGLTCSNSGSENTHDPASSVASRLTTPGDARRADWTGDNYTDLNIYRAGYGQWVWLHSSWSGAWGYGGWGRQSDWPILPTTKTARTS